MNGKQPHRPRVLMGRPGHFAVRYVINPWMAGHVGVARTDVALRQWQALYDIVAKHAHVELIDDVDGQPDMCFVANAGLVVDGRAVLSRFRVPQRVGEQAHFHKWFESAGYELVELPADEYFEGEGDALVQPGEPVVWAGYGVRSSLESHRALAEQLNVEVVSLRLIDERFYHLDTCFYPLPGGCVVYYPGAFGKRSLRVLEDRVPADKRIAVSTDDAMRFASNAVRLGNTIIANHAGDELRARLSDWGYEVVTTPLSEFMLAGGAAKCLTLLLEQELPDDFEHRLAVESTIRQTTLAIEGHLLDTGLMNDALDRVTDEGGSFHVSAFNVGERRDQPSHAHLRISAPDDATLDLIVGRLMGIGAEPTAEPIDARLEPVEQAGVAPRAFYSTTIYPTDVRIDGKWLRCTGQRMDAVVVVDGDQATCRLIRDVKAGDRVVCGHEGVRIHTPQMSERQGDFAFMTGSVSSERRVELAIDQLAWEMDRIKQRGGRIAFVAGPVVIHTGGAEHFVRLIEAGYINTLLTGNALPVHDIENNLFGTSLGVDLQRGGAVHGGHQHHLRAINQVRRAGSIAAAVEQGVVTGGIMHACVKHGVDYVLAGSIRDDGPLPDTLMDLVEAQRAYAEAIEGASMIVMLASMLHAIGTGNMTPAGVRLVCVDISPAVVTKLADRGSVESTGIVTDVGLFLRLLADRLVG